MPQVASISIGSFWNACNFFSQETLPIQALTSRDEWRTCSLRDDGRINELENALENGAFSYSSSTFAGETGAVEALSLLILFNHCI